MGLKRITGLMLACMLFAGAAACSSSAKKAASVAAGGAKTTTTAASSAGAGSSTTAATTSGGSGGSSGSGVDCAAAAAAYEKAQSGAASALTPGGKFDPSALDKEYAAAAPLVPSRLKGDYDTLGAAIKKFVAALNGVDLSNPASYANPATVAKLQAASQSFEAPQVKAASQALQSYFGTGCK